MCDAKHKIPDWVLKDNPNAIKLNSIINGDCRDVLKTMPDKSVDLVFTDPPYNVGKSYDGYSDDLSEKGYHALMQTIVDESHRISRRGVMCYVGSLRLHLFCKLMPESRVIIVHQGASSPIKEKGIRQQYYCLLTTAIPVKVCRDLWTSIRLPGEGFYFREERFDHPGLTSLKLTKQAITLFSSPDEIILDPFCGTGTTAVASIETGRRFIGIEQSSKYCDLARSRLEGSILQPDLFIEKITQMDLWENQCKK